MLSAETLIGGAEASSEIEVPARLLEGNAAVATEDRRVRLRPLRVRDLRLIARAARDNEDLVAALMVQRALVEPELSIEQVGALPVGLMQFLLREVNRVSGITATEDEILAAMEDPLVRASLLLSKELGWTPEEIGRLTMGEVLMHVASLRAEASAAAPRAGGR